jgi:hypothetical protein
VEGVRDQADDNVDLGDFGVKGLVVVDVELMMLACVHVQEGRSYADGCRVGNALGKSLSLLKSPAGDNDLDTRLSKNLRGRAGDEPSTEQKN